MDHIFNIRESFHPIFRRLFFIISSLCIALGSVLGLTIAISYTGSLFLHIISSGVMIVFVGILLPYTLLRAEFRLSISNTKVTARIWPLRGVEIDLHKVTSAQVIKIDPIYEYGGWGVKGSAKDRLLGGGGVTALRVTYTDNGNRTLTFLTNEAEIACHLINNRRS